MGQCPCAAAENGYDDEGEGPRDKLETAERKKVLDELLHLTAFSRDELLRIRQDMQVVASEASPHAPHAGDDDASIQLDKSSFERVLCRLTKRKSEAEAAELLFHALDTDANGLVDYRELAVGLSMLAKGSIDEKLELLFNMFDLDRDGFITRSEVERVVRAVFLVLGGVDGVIGAGGLAPGAENEHAMFKEAIDSLFADLAVDEKIDRAHFRKGFARFNRLLPPDSIPRELSQDLDLTLRDEADT